MSYQQTNSNKKPQQFVTPTGNNKNNPKQIHVAHRRSPSELTTLMIEQLSLQRQLEMVQQEQQQIIQRQQQLADQASGASAASGTGGGAAVSPFLPQPPAFNGLSPSGFSSHSRGHSRNNSYTHGGMPGAAPSPGGTGSSHGHARRQSLGLNEAKKAAAEEQAKRQGQASGHSTPPIVNTTLSSAFSGSGSGSSAGHGRTHSRNNSLNAFSPNKGFQFPPPQASTEDEQGSIPDYYYTSSPRRSGYHSNSHSRSNSGFYANKHNNQGQAQGQGQGQQSLLLEPAATFSSGHKRTNSNGTFNSNNASNNNNNNSNNGQQRKSLFAPYLPQANIPQLLQEGKLVLGTLRVNKKNRSDAWVSTDGVLDADIFICGSKDRNRALENDLVAVELLCVDEVWGSKKEKEEKKRRKDQGLVQQDLLNSGEDYHNDATILSPRKDSTRRSSFVDDSTSHRDILAGAMANSGSDTSSGADKSEGDSSEQQPGLKRRGSLKQRPTQKKNDDVEVEGQSLLLVEEEEINDDFKPLYAGHIVAVLDRIPGQLFSGTLGLLRPSQSSSSGSSNSNSNNGQKDEPARKPKIVWFKPTDKKVPLVAIPTEQAPEDFVSNSEKYTNKLFIASIKRWPITSLHPFGTLVEQIGEINESKTEVEAILKNNNFESNEYVDPQDKTKEKSIFKPYPIQTDFSNRPVYESENIHIIEQNLQGPHDIAVQIENIHEQDKNLVRFSVHVVDVTEHIESGSSLDRRARKRSTGVYLPQKTVYLLPKRVNEELSLKKNTKSTTISVHYDIDLSSNRILNHKVEESFVIPRGANVSAKELESKIQRAEVANIQTISKLFYALRLNTSGDIASRLSLLDALEDEKTYITDLNYFFNESGSIMKEIHFKVNSTIAGLNYSKLGDKSFLRRHAEPLSTKFQSFIHRISEFSGLDTILNLRNPELCLKSISNIEDPHLRKCIEILFYKTLNRSKYFIAGKVDPDQFGHYLLNYPIYTHFTSPFKRYADHVVHRQLKSVLKNTYASTSDNDGNDVDSLKITAEYCNFKKDCAFAAQEQSLHLLLCKTINDMCKNSNNMDQILTLGLVIQVYESSFDVYVPEFGIEKRVHGDQLPVSKAEFDNINKTLELYWNPTMDSATFIPSDEKKPNSYRSSIKNNFKSSSRSIAKTELEKLPEVSESLRNLFEDMNLQAPRLDLLAKLTNQTTAGSDLSSPLDAFKEYTTTRVEGDIEKSYVQEIRELDYVPVLVRAEVGMALPCLSVRALNPFL